MLTESGSNTKAEQGNGPTEHRAMINYVNRHPAETPEGIREGHGTVLTLQSPRLHLKDGRSIPRQPASHTATASHKERHGQGQTSLAEKKAREHQWNTCIFFTIRDLITRKPLLLENTRSFWIFFESLSPA